MKSPLLSTAESQHHGLSVDQASKGGLEASMETILGAILEKIVILEETLQMDLRPNERDATLRQLHLAMAEFQQYTNLCREARRAQPPIH